MKDPAQIQTQMHLGQSVLAKLFAIANLFESPHPRIQIVDEEGREEWIEGQIGRFFFDGRAFCQSAFQDLDLLIAARKNLKRVRGYPFSDHVCFR